MSTLFSIRWFIRAIAVAVAMILTAGSARGHCDGLDGPVVVAGRKALAAGNVNLALVWVQKNDEAEIRRAFEKTLIVRKLSPEAKSLADTFFFETLVRLHRAGEGAPYTGLKPAGRDLGLAIPAADKALETGDVEPLMRFLVERTEHGVREHFKEALARKTFPADDTEAGRKFVKAYVDYIHYVEGIHQATAGTAHGHELDRQPATGHKHPE